MLHMKLNSAVSVFAVAAAFSVLLPPSSAFGGVCFLPDCQDSDTMHGDINMNVNQDTEWCEKKGYTYYASGQCPQYQAQTGKCKKDDYYLKCDAKTWCQQNGYNTTTCSIPNYVDQPCPSFATLYKGCKTDNDRACKDTGYTKTCPSGQKLKKNSGRCSYDSSYGTCCKPTGCPNQYNISPICTKTPTNGHDGCEYECYKCCSDECPVSGTSKNYTGSTARSTECGSTCRYFRSCPSGASTSYHGSSAGYDDNGKWCGNYCSDSCSSGSSNPSCAWDEKRVSAGSSECGTCYKCTYNTDCNATNLSCSGGWCNSTNSCGKCTSCGYPCTPKTDETGCINGTKSCSNGCSGTRKCCKKCPPVRRANPAAENDSWWMSDDCWGLAAKADHKNWRFSEEDCPNSSWHIPSLAELEPFGAFHREYLWVSDAGCPAGEHMYKYVNNETGEQKTGCHNPSDKNVWIHTRCIRKFQAE